MPANSFRYWVVLGGMRTGSNLLEEHLAAFPGIAAHGELFNPHFFGRPSQKSQFGLSMQSRDSDPLRVIEVMQASGDGLHGFRLFHDHDRRVISHVLNDPNAAKIILTRRPVDSYVSLKVARKTGQWWLGDLKTARVAKVTFDGEGYSEFLDTLSAFQSRISRILQTTGQTAFNIDYDDLADGEVVQGLGKFLGATGPQDTAGIRAKVQNPDPLSARLTNPDEAQEVLSRLATPDAGSTTLREPGRGPGLKFFRACANAPLLYMPIRGAGIDPVPHWLASVDPDHSVLSSLTQQDMRRWKRKHPGHRSFTVVRHPLPRAYDAFCRFLLPTGAEAYADLRDALINRYDVPLPRNGTDASWSADSQNAAFHAFLLFLKGNLGGQTSLRVDSTWASQGTLLQAITDFAIPDRVIREEDLSASLAEVARDAKVDAPKMTGSFSATSPFELAEIHDEKLEKAVRAAYQRDFMMFGFDRWKGD
ncbi:MAG: sulfotransferase [Boseongicola sp.]|nr:sulfotransferase [Boseongicola sp.]